MTTTEKVTLLISIIGALAWLPQLFDLFKSQEILGKIISRYDNFNDKQSFYLYKLSLFSKNKPFHLKQITCTLEYDDGQKFNDTARNMRYVIFNGNEELQVLGKEYINNFSILPNDTNIEGYLFFCYDFSNRTSKIIKTTFTFESYDDKVRTLSFEEKYIDGKQLFYDDSIWKKKL